MSEEMVPTGEGVTSGAASPADVLEHLRRVVRAFAGVAFVSSREECMAAHGVGPATPLERAGRT